MLEQETKKEVKLLSPKLDVIFQALFGEERNKRITKSFLETIIKEPIHTINLNKNPILRREFKDDKLGVLDILAEINENEKVNIELQITNKANIVERILYYWSRLYSKSIKSGEDYEALSKTIIIAILDFELEKPKGLDYYTKWQIMEVNKKIVLTEKLELYIIELPKIKGKEEEKEKILDWLYFIENPKSERVAKNMEENEELKEAVETLNKMSKDERMQRIEELREKAIRDEKAIYRKGTQDGFNEGEKSGIEKGKAIGEKSGIEKGKVIGEKSGIEKGQKKEKMKIAKKMLEEGIPKETVLKITGLKEEEI